MRHFGVGWTETLVWPERTELWCDSNSNSSTSTVSIFVRYQHCLILEASSDFAATRDYKLKLCSAETDVRKIPDHKFAQHDANCVTRSLYHTKQILQQQIA